MKKKKTNDRKPAKGSEAQEEQPKQAPLHPLCPVVGFGASAGGLEAFQEILQALPEDTGVAFVFIQHLDPKHISILSELLGKSTRMPVLQVKDQMQLEPNKVYVIPPNVGMRLSDSKLRLTERAGGPGPHLPIDEFFRSLAEDRGSRAIAVILSGTASDGTLGLGAIKEAGGITLAQDHSAKFDAMPRNAIAAGWVDLIMSPTEIAHEILRICQHPYVARSEEPLPDALAGPALAEPVRFDEILALLRNHTGVDFTLYKPGTLQRRILRRMALHKAETTAQYLALLRESKAEIKALFQDILISVTGFFRENPTFEAVKKQVLPALLRERSAENPVRVWVAGCSTGEEVYSMAICLLEYMRDADMDIPIQIFGTDLSEPALERARAGIYPESIAADVTPERLRRFFTRVDGRYQISRAVRDMCIFAQQNLTKDPPFSKLDLITCRNVLIYLGPALQAKVMRLFHYALKPEGYLVLGLSETVGNAYEQFSLLDRHLKIYTRKSGSFSQVEFGPYDETHLETPGKRTPPAATALEAQRRVDQFILSRYSPPGVLISHNFTIFQFHGHTAPYLEHAAGEPALEITRMLRSELVIEFRRLFERAHKRLTAVRGELIRLTEGDRELAVRICITPMMLPGDSDRRYLVLFEEQKEAAEPAKREKRPPKPVKPTVAARRVRELEEELASTKHYLESIVEEQQATTEELKSANEEVQSSNEELQSTNEELLTAKEELQSTNEELTTVNEEMHGRNAELTQINNDLNNLLSSVNIPIVMLGSDLRIRRFTPQAEKVLNLLATDIGRPVSDFKPKINIPDLEELFRDVMENLRVKEREVHDREGRSYSMWMRPYRTSDNKIDGAVMVLIDVTERKQAAEARYRRLFEASKDGIVIADAESGAILDVNPYMKNFGVSRPGSAGLRYGDLEFFRGTTLNSETLDELHQNETIQKFITARVPGGRTVDLEITGNIYMEGERRAIQFNLRDVTDRRKMEEAARRGAELTQPPPRVEAIGRLAGSVAEDFNQLLRTLSGQAQTLKQLGDGNPNAPDMAEIGRTLERAGTLARQLTILGGRRELRPEILNVNDLLADMEPIIRIALAPNIKLEVERAPDLKPVSADRGQFEHVILNLALNAQESLPGVGSVSVRTYNMTVDETYAREHPAVKPGAYTVLEVSDSGAAVNDHSPHTPDRSNPHALADLSPIAATIRQFGGHLWAASEFGRGATFRIFLPQA
ncbi:MAG TPA: CheR family methyltransferase [Bryobacteraceae bacterium]